VREGQYQRCEDYQDGVVDLAQRVAQAIGNKQEQRDGNRHPPRPDPHGEQYQGK
jgi:hypothetical protein